MYEPELVGRSEPAGAGMPIRTVKFCSKSVVGLSTGVPDVGLQLAAAKPLAWRGRGELPQLPWPCPCRGLVVVVDLWSGLADMLVATIALGMRCIAVAVEADEHLRTASEECFPNLVTLPHVQDFKADMLGPLLARRQIEAFLVGGKLGNRGNAGKHGASDKSATRRPEDLYRVVNDIRSHAPTVPIFQFLEAAAPAPTEMVELCSQLVGGPPVQVDARMWGWVKRRRLFWLQGPAGGVDAQRCYHLPNGFSTQEADEVNAAVFKIQSSGTKPCPSAVKFGGGFDITFDPAKVVQSTQAECFHTFTAEFRHPTDRVRRVSSQAADRFFEDQKRFPHAAYENSNLAWRGKEWRTLSPLERASIHCMPAALLEAVNVTSNPDEKRAFLNTAVGDGFHIPSLMLILIFLFQLSSTPMVAAIPRHLPDIHESALRRRIRGTIFVVTALDNATGLLTPSDVIEDIQSQLRNVRVSDECYRQVFVNLKELPLQRLQGFWLFLVSKGHCELEAPPSWAAQKDRALLSASLGLQRAAGDSSKGLDHLLPPGLGKH